MAWVLPSHLVIDVCEYKVKSYPWVSALQKILWEGVSIKNDAQFHTEGVVFVWEKVNARMVWAVNNVSFLVKVRLFIIFLPPYIINNFDVPGVDNIHPSYFHHKVDLP